MNRLKNRSMLLLFEPFAANLEHHMHFPMDRRSLLGIRAVVMGSSTASSALHSDSHFNSLPLLDKVAVVTGSARGICRTVAVSMAFAGATIAGLAGTVSPILEYPLATSDDWRKTKDFVK